LLRVTGKTLPTHRQLNFGVSVTDSSSSARKRAPNKWLAVSSITLAVLGLTIVLFSYATITGAYKGAGKVLALSWVAQWKMNYPDLEGSNDCSGAWSPSIDASDPYMLPAYPDTYAAYWALIMSHDQEISPEPIAYELKGRFPYARYMTFHVYDGATGDYFAALKDLDIEPDAGSVNPFQANIDRTAANRNYTLWIVPEGASLPQINGLKNVIRVPKQFTESPTVMAIDRPDNGQPPSAGVPLPKVKVFHAQTGEPVLRCNPLRLKSIIPSKKSGIKKAQTWDKMKTIGDGQAVRLYHSTGGGLYPNKHLSYLTTGLDTQFGNVVMVKFKAPTTPNTQTGFGIHTHTEDMRFWSMCLGGMYATNTSACLVDDQAIIGDDGLVTLAIGPDDKNLRKLAQQHKINYMDWGYHQYPDIIFRHLQGEKEFDYSSKNVPIVDVTLPLWNQGGERTIGTYSPTGFYCNHEEFEKNLCDIKEYSHPGLEFIK
jgi:hypothetical protein